MENENKTILKGYKNVVSGEKLAELRLKELAKVEVSKALGVVVEEREALRLQKAIKLESAGFTKESLAVCTRSTLKALEYSDEEIKQIKG